MKKIAALLTLLTSALLLSACADDEDWGYHHDHERHREHEEHEEHFSAVQQPGGQIAPVVVGRETRAGS
jgi:hypothetical protein